MMQKNKKARKWHFAAQVNDQTRWEYAVGFQGWRPFGRDVDGFIDCLQLVTKVLVVQMGVNRDGGGSDYTD